MNFTHFVDKLAFSLKKGYAQLMSKLNNCMQQVAEIAGFQLFGAADKRGLESKILQRRIWICLAALAILSGCHSHKRSDEAPTNSHSTTRTLERGLPGEPRTLDPQLADDNFSFEVVRDLYEGLTAEDQHGLIIPGAASSWSVNAAGTVYIFTLRKNARWSDGSLVTASEFVNGLRRAVDPNTASGSAQLLDVIKGANSIIDGHANAATLAVTALGNNVIRIELNHPASYILQILSQPIAAPLHKANGNDATRSSRNKFSRISNGAFVLSKRVDGSYIELERNQQYWDVSHVLIERVRYVTSASEATELREYMAGQLDMTYSIPLPDLRRLLKEYASQVQMAPILGTFYLALNMAEPLIRDNADLRQALSMAVNRGLIAREIMLGVAPAYSFVAPGIRAYVPQAYKWATWPRNSRLSYARKLYARAGYTKNSPLHLRLYFNSDDTVRRVMIAIAESWRENLGITTELISNEFRVFLVGRKDHSRWDVARIGWTADYDDPASFLDVFADGSSQNDPEYVSTEYNDLIRNASIETDNSTRIELFEKAEATLLNDYPIIPVYYYKARRLVKPFVGGATITPLDRTYSKYLFWKNP